MANISVVPQVVGVAGLAPVFTGSLSTSNVYQIPNNGKTIIHLKKTGAGACTVTFKTPRQIGALDVAEGSGTVPATTGDVMFSNLDPATYNVPGTGYLELTLSEITGLSMAAFQVEG